MNFKTEIDKKNNIRKHTISGVIDLSELRTALNSIYSDSQYSTDMDSLWDLRHATGFEALRNEDIELLIDLVSQKWNSKSTVKSALVASKDLSYGLARMYELQLQPRSKNKVNVFRDIEEALKWLL